MISENYEIAIEPDLQAICNEVLGAYQMGGLADGRYGDFAKRGCHTRLGSDQCDGLREVAQALVNFQHEYAENALDPGGMPVNEHYRYKLIEIVSKARAALGTN